MIGSGPVPDFMVGDGHAFALAQHVQHVFDHVGFDHDTRSRHVVEKVPLHGSVALPDVSQASHDISEGFGVFRTDQIFDSDHDRPFVHSDVAGYRSGPVGGQRRQVGLVLCSDIKTP